MKHSKLASIALLSASMATQLGCIAPVRQLCQKARVHHKFQQALRESLNISASDEINRPSDVKDDGFNAVFDAKTDTLIISKEKDPSRHAQISGKLLMDCLGSMHNTDKHARLAIEFANGNIAIRRDVLERAIQSFRDATGYDFYLYNSTRVNEGSYDVEGHKALISSRVFLKRDWPYTMNAVIVRFLQENERRDYQPPQTDIIHERNPVHPYNADIAPGQIRADARRAPIQSNSPLSR